MIGRRPLKAEPEKSPQAQRVGHPPRDARRALPRSGARARAACRLSYVRKRVGCSLSSCPHCHGQAILPAFQPGARCRAQPGARCRARSPGSDFTRAWLPQRVITALRSCRDFHQATSFDFLLVSVRGLSRDFAASARRASARPACSCRPRNGCSAQLQEA